MERLLDAINSPKDLKKLHISKLPVLAEELRKEIIETVSRNGGHLAPSLGAVEIILSLHYILDVPNDKILWDVGHQAYAHKILTERKDLFSTIRQLGGLSGFPNVFESKYDFFTVGHSSTAISQGLGLAFGRDLKGEKYKVVSVVGDAALASGMSFEALNHAGQSKENILIVLNDNEHSISRSVGALSKYLNRIMVNPVYNKLRADVQKLVKKIPVFGFKTYRAARKIEEGLKNLVVPGIFFEELGIRYFGPVDGHDAPSLIKTLKSVIDLDGPKILHVLTKKGKGYKFAEDNPSGFHGTAPFDIKTGKTKKKKDIHGDADFSNVFGNKLCELASKNKSIVAVTAAMPEGTGLKNFVDKFPDRFFDVGIAEEHAVTMSAGLAKSGFKPYVAIYSTFLQRAYDQIIHDVCLQKLPVVFCLDRAGLSGEDGPTHHGVFDICYLRHIPGIVLMAPRDGLELEKMLEFSVDLNNPCAIRYPKGSSFSHLSGSTFSEIKLGKSEKLREGKNLTIIAVGSMTSVAIKTADLLSDDGIEAGVINARFIKPIDSEMLEEVSKKTKNIVIIEEGVAEAGFGSAVLEFFERENISGIKVKRIGLPDQFIEHGGRLELLKKYHMTADEIADTIKQEFVKK